MLATSGAPSQPRSPDGPELIDALPDAFLDALGDAVREMRQQGERELERIGAEARARDAELRAVIAEQRAEILVLKAEFRERVDGELARISTVLAAVKNGEDADPNLVAEIAAKRVADDLSVMIRSEVEAIGTDIKQMSDGFDARIDARITAQAPDMPALVASAVDQAIVSRAILGAVDVQKMLSGEIEKLPRTVTEDQIRFIAVEEAARAVAAGIPDLPDVVPLVGKAVDNAVAAAFVTIPVPRDGKSVNAEDVRRMVANEVGQLPEPVHADEIATIAAAEAAKAIEALPVPEIITADQMLGFVRSEISKAVEALPEPVHADEIATIAAAEAAKAIEALPVPEIITADQMVGFVRGEISKAVEALPVQISVDDVRATALDVTARAIADIPAPQAGAISDLSEVVSSAIEAAIGSLEPHCTAEQIRAIAEEEAAKALAGMPEPVPLSVDDLVPAIENAAQQAAKSLPLPKEPAEIDYDRVWQFIEDRISAIPVAANGTGYKSALIDQDGVLVLIRDDGAMVTVGAVAGKDADTATIANVVRDELSKLPTRRDIDPAEIREIIKSELRGLEPEAREVSEIVLPPHLLGMITTAHRALAEPLVVRANDATSPAITLNVAGGGSAPKPVNKTVKTRRDPEGNLTYDVIETEA
jgi:hypothetical protein